MCTNSQEIIEAEVNCKIYSHYGHSLFLGISPWLPLATFFSIEICFLFKKILMLGYLNALYLYVVCFLFLMSGHPLLIWCLFSRFFLGKGVMSESSPDLVVSSSVVT